MGDGFGFYDDFIGTCSFFVELKLFGVISHTHFAICSTQFELVTNCYRLTCFYPLRSTPLFAIWCDYYNRGTLYPHLLFNSGSVVCTNYSCKRFRSSLSSLMLSKCSATRNMCLYLEYSSSAFCNAI